MSEVMLRENLIASFHALQGQFETSLAEARELDQQFTDLRQQFHRHMETHLTTAQKNLPNDNPLSTQLKGFLSAVAATDTAWNNEISKRDKGIKFRKGFNDSLLVFIYGKVKSGKSSLGNYMAWGHTDPDQRVKEALPTDSHPSYFTHENTCASNGDSQDEALNRREFRVGATEATSSIQGFRLPGLTWVDSPGLHSVNEQNGRLAQDYVEHADLILYTMRSDAPGRASDLNEIRSLNTQGKEMLILVTGSDLNDEDWDDELEEIKVTVQMKSAERRQDQRDVISRELGFINSNHLLSISARYAQEHANDFEKLADSGMGQLFSTLHRISQDKGLRLKKNVPMQNFYNFMQGCQMELSPYKDLIADLETTISRLQADVPKAVTREIRVAQATMRRTIDIDFDELAGRRNEEYLMNVALRKAHRNWDSLLQGVIGQALSNVFAQITEDFKDAVSKTWHAAALKLPDFNLDKAMEQIPGGVRKGNRGLTSGVGTLIGAGLGFVAGGPAGAAIGATVGGSLGGVAGRGAEVSMREVEVITGDNLEQLLAQTHTAYAQAIEATVRQHADFSLTRHLDAALQTARILTQEVTRTQLGFEELKQTAQQKIQK
ncbi:dynamin family protein [Aeromonas sp. 97A]|uniref:dynamin family protein n=1 Tax=Aeromonas sp. 97A TaxID=3452731 RepID=UPI003F7A6533